MKRFFVLALTIAFITINIVPAIASEPMRIILSQEENSSTGLLFIDEEDFSKPPLIKNNRLFVALRDITKAINFDVNYTNKTKKININGINRKTLKKTNVEFTLGRQYAYIDGQKINIDTPALIKSGTTYVPLRFVSEVLGAEVKYDKKNNQVDIDTGFLHASAGKYHFLLDKENSRIYSYIKDSNPKKVADLDPELIEYVRFSAEKTPKGNILLSILDNYGEPHIHTDVYSIYINPANDIMHKTTVYYYQRCDENIKFYNGYVILTDGKYMFLIDDETGKINKKINFDDLLKKDKDDEYENYSVEGMGENYILVRSHTNGVLHLVDLKNNEIVELYKVLLNETEQEYVEYEDCPYYDDHLEFLGQKGNILYFKYNYSIIHSKEDPNNPYTYELK